MAKTEEQRLEELRELLEKTTVTEKREAIKRELEQQQAEAMALTAQQAEAEEIRLVPNKPLISLDDARKVMTISAVTAETLQFKKGGFPVDQQLVDADVSAEEKNKIVSTVKEIQQKVFEQMQKISGELGIQLQKDANGNYRLNQLDGSPLTPERYQSLQNTYMNQFNEVAKQYDQSGYQIRMRQNPMTTPTSQLSPTTAAPKPQPGSVAKKEEEQAEETPKLVRH